MGAVTGGVDAIATQVVSIGTVALDRR